MTLSDLVGFVKDIAQMDLEDALESREAERVRMYLCGVEETLRAVGYDASWIASCVSPLLFGTYLKNSFYSDRGSGLDKRLRMYYGFLAEADILRLAASHGDVNALQ